jgi:inner membrane protein
MPSPVGHLVAGVAIAWAAEALPRHDRHAAAPGGQTVLRSAVTPLVVACAALALAPDLDILTAAHRSWTHSVGAILLVGGAAAVVARVRRLPVVLTALACASALGSHVLLDWLGHDQTAPIGVMALWPFSHAYLYSGIDLFADVSRRYWRPEEFFLGNALSVARELLILCPLAASAFWLRRRATRERAHPAASSP